MARRNVIIRSLPAIETLGSVSVICSDKTGTLTRNEMNVTSAVTSRQHFHICGSGYEPVGDIRLDGQAISASDYPILWELGRATALCNDANLIRKEEAWIVEGDPMEGALLAFSGKIGFDAPERHAQWTRTDIIPFDTKHKFMATLNHDHQNHASVFVKGAPEIVLAMCREQHLGMNETELLNHSYWCDQAELIARQGQRVLALATKPMKPEHTVLENTDIQDSLIFIGLIGLLDPPRSEAITAVAECQSAGIEVKMITGDHAATAVAIGKQLGLRNTDNTLTGAELDKLDDQALTAIVSKTGIFARTSPEHKLRLVMALQANGMTVAMAGDGVNDAPAREGRTVHDNIKKVISWTLPTNAGEALTIILALMLEMTLPIAPIQILWVNMITAVTLGIALAFEPTEGNTMHRPPRAHDEPMLSGALVWHIVLVASLFLLGVFGIYDYAIIRGYSVDLARTLAMNTLVVLEIFHLFFIRNIYGTSFSWKEVCGTKVVWIAVIAVSLGQFAITYLPWLQIVFETEEVALWDGFLIVGIGVMMFIIIEIEKQIRLRLYN
jgi:magnesium-transporting ATPase (P-type)